MTTRLTWKALPLAAALIMVLLDVITTQAGFTILGAVEGNEVSATLFNWFGLWGTGALICAAIITIAWPLWGSSTWHLQRAAAIGSAVGLSYIALARIPVVLGNLHLFF